MVCRLWQSNSRALLTMSEQTLCPYLTSPIFDSSNCPCGWFLLNSLVVLYVLHSIALLWPSEWEVISRLFIVDQPISIHCFKETTPSGPTTQYTTQPGKNAKLAKSTHPTSTDIRNWSNAAKYTWTLFDSTMSLIHFIVCVCVCVFSDLCWECRESFLFQQQRDLREYTQATVYIRKVVEDKRVCL